MKIQIGSHQHFHSNFIFPGGFFKSLDYTYRLLNIKFLEGNNLYSYFHANSNDTMPLPLVRGY